MKFPAVTHVIFDLDGLLLNTEELYYIAFQNICTPYGKVYSYELKSQIMGKKLDCCAEKIIKELDLPITVKQFKSKLDNQIDILFSQSKVLPGVKKLINHLVNHKVPIGLCTSSTEKAYLVKTAQHEDLFSLFKPKVFCGSDKEIKNGKPHSDAYEITRRRFRPNIPQADKCLVFEDSVNGVMSAMSAKMQCVMVPDPRLEAEYLKKATCVISSLEDFVPEDFGLPPYPKAAN